MTTSEAKEVLSHGSWASKEDLRGALAEKVARAINLLPVGDRP